MKVLKSSIKNASFGCFGQQFEKLLSYLKSALSDLSLCKFGAKIKIFKLGTKNAFSGYFWAGLLNT